MSCRVRTGAIAERYELIDAASGDLVRSLSLKELFDDPGGPRLSPAVCPETGNVVGMGICAPMTVHRLRQAGAVSARCCAKVGANTARDPYTQQPVAHASLRLGTQEVDCFNACGSTHLLRGIRGRDERPVPACPSCSAPLWGSGGSCPWCQSPVTEEAQQWLPHCLLTLRFNLAVARMCWTPGVPGPPDSSLEPAACPTPYPLTLAEALARLASM